MTKRIITFLLGITMLVCLTGCGKTYTYNDVQIAYEQGYDDGYADAMGGYGGYADNSARIEYDNAYEQGYSDGYADYKDGYAYEDAHFGNRTEADKGYGDGYYDGYYDAKDGY